MKEISGVLQECESAGRFPRVTAYNRIDGPGSSLDLREFQEAFWRLPVGDVPSNDDDFSEWSRLLPRTVGITISTGCVVEAHPMEPGRIGIVSHDFGYHHDYPAGQVPYHQSLWLLKLMDIFGLSGVCFELANLIPGIKASGLGGSATAATGVCLLANALCDRPFGADQIIAMASLMEQDLGVSITGTQEQANVVYGGVTDYVWFPWGVPGHDSSYGSSIRHKLMDERSFPQLAERLRIYHSGTERSSIDVNSVWRKRLSDTEGYAAHLSKLGIAHSFREGIRGRDWLQVRKAISLYRGVRVSLCPAYMTSQCWDIQTQCERHDAEAFPLGAGGGGALLIFGSSPELLLKLDGALSAVYRRIPFSIRPRGHEFANIPSSCV